MRGIAALGLILALSFVPSVSEAGEEQDVVYQKHTVIVLEGGLLEASLAQPDGSQFESVRNPQLKSLIKPRTSFRAKVLRSLRVGR